jgi:hypothetical protein
MNINLGFYACKDEAVINCLSVEFGKVKTDLLTSYNIENEFLECNNIYGELFLFTENYTKFCSVEVEVNTYDDRLEDFFDRNHGYELGNIKIHGLNIDSIDLTDDLLKDIKHQAKNIIDALNESLND